MFKFQVEELAKTLFTQHGLNNYTLIFKNRNSVLGSCNRSKKVITLSNNFVLINNHDEVKKVLLHEIAHALTKGGHNTYFRAKCLELGISPKKNNTTALVVHRYIGICQKCGQKIHRNRIIRGYHCKNYKIIWEKNPHF